MSATTAAPQPARPSALPPTAKMAAAEAGTPQAIADRLNVAVTAVHMRLSRARQRLAERLATHGDFAPGEPASETKT